VIDGKTSALAKLDLQIEELPKRPAQIEVEMANDTAAMVNAQAVTQRVADAKTAFDAADAAVQKAQGSLPTSIGAGGKQVVDTSGLMPLIAASEAAQKAYNDVRRSVGAAEAELVRLKNHQAALQAETKSLDKKALDLTAKREALVKDLEKAKADLAAMSGAPAAPKPSAPSEKTVK
jgi:predicted  nucleic acid-binding Zn-ribbon protein